MYFLGKLVGRAPIMLNPFEKVFLDFTEVDRETGAHYGNMKSMRTLWNKLANFLF